MDASRRRVSITPVDMMYMYLVSLPDPQVVQETRTGLPNGRMVLDDRLRLHRSAADQFWLGTHQRLTFSLALHVPRSWQHNDPLGFRHPVLPTTGSHPSERLQRARTIHRHRSHESEQLRRKEHSFQGRTAMGVDEGRQILADLWNGAHYAGG